VRFGTSHRPQPDGLEINGLKGLKRQSRRWKAAGLSTYAIFSSAEVFSTLKGLTDDVVLVGLAI